MNFNQSETIRNIKRYMSELEKETGTKPYKPFSTIYAKKRHWLNLFKYILGEYKFGWFEKDKEPSGYKNAFELYADSLDLDTKDITFQEDITNH